MENAIEQKPISIYVPYTLFVMAMLSIFIITLNKVEKKPGQTEYAAVSFISPTFELESLTGGKVNLLDYRGKVVFINFWATWCGTCEVEMPSMEKLYRRYKDDGFEMLTISVDKDQSLIAPFMKKYNLTFPVLLDPDSEVAKQDYKTTGVPETFIVNRDGIIIFKKIGPDDWATDEMMEAFARIVLES